MSLKYEPASEPLHISQMWQKLVEDSAALGKQSPESPGCHEESEARMVKVNVLTLSASPRRLN